MCVVLKYCSVTIQGTLPLYGLTSKAMVVDLLAASRRPLQRLLQNCRFSEWENIALFLDSGATEAVRWAGGLGYILMELGISVVVDLQSFVPGRGRAERAPDSDHITRGIFLVTTFIWDVEGAILNAAKTYGLSEVTVACSVSEEAHACHPHAAQISEDTAGQVSFADVSQQLNTSLVRMLKIEAQSSSRTSFKGFSSDASTSSLFDMEIPSEGVAYNHLRHDDPPAKVLVSVVHSPLHMGCFLRCPPSPGGYYSVRDEPQICPAFSLANPACAGTFPLRRCDVGGVRASEVGELLAAAASVEGEGGDGILEGRILAEEVPRDERLRYRLLAHVLAEVLWEQLLLDVSGGGGVFTLGDTSRLIGTTLAAAAEEIKRSTSTSSADGGSIGFGGGGFEKRREASIVLVDRTLDLAAGASHGGSLLQRILSSLPRTGTAPNTPTCNAEWSPTAAAHQQDVGVTLPALTPGLGVPASAAATSPWGGTEMSESGDVARGKGSIERRREREEGMMEGAEDGMGRPRLGAMKALSTFAWPAPLSLCHPGSGAAERAVHGMACFGEEEGQAALVSALERCISDHGCVPPARKRRGMGLSIMALVTSLARGNPRPGGMTGHKVCIRCRGLVQVALAAMEAHQRTSAQAGCSWAETVAAERVQRQELRDGGTSRVVMDQLCATLRSVEAGSGSVRRALLLALRGVSLTGGSIGADEASSFRKAWVSCMLAGGLREERSALPAYVAEAVERLVGDNAFRGREREKECEEAGVRLELEDIARERIQRLREAAGARSHLTTPALRDLAFQPYTFVASVGDGDHRDGWSHEGTGHGGDDDDGWDDWGEEHGDGQGVVNARSTSTENTMECDTLVGRLAGLMLDRTNTKSTVPDLQESKLMSAASVGLGLLSSGLKKFARIGTGRVLGNRKNSRPTDRPVLVIFVVGGFTPQELAEVNGVVRCAASAAAADSGNLDTEIVLAGTTISTPDMIYEQIIARPPAGQA